MFITTAVLTSCRFRSTTEYRLPRDHGRIHEQAAETGTDSFLTWIEHLKMRETDIHVIKLSLETGQENRPQLFGQEDQPGGAVVHGRGLAAVTCL